MSKQLPISLSRQEASAALANTLTTLVRPLHPPVFLGRYWRSGWTVDTQRVDIPVCLNGIGLPGDYLWVREPFMVLHGHEDIGNGGAVIRVMYRHDGAIREVRCSAAYAALAIKSCGSWKTRAMPLGLSRLELIVNDVRLDVAERCSNGAIDCRWIFDVRNRYMIPHAVVSERSAPQVQAIGA